MKFNHYLSSHGFEKRFSDCSFSWVNGHVIKLSNNLLIFSFKLLSRKISCGRFTFCWTWTDHSWGGQDTNERAQKCACLL